MTQFKVYHPESPLHTQQSHSLSPMLLLNGASQVEI